MQDSTPSEKKYLYPFFVDRDGELEMLSKSAGGAEIRIVLVVGEFGIGKTKVLNEFKAKLQGQELRAVHIDLNKSRGKRGYMYIITETRNNLGLKGFEPVNEAILKITPKESIPVPEQEQDRLEKLRSLMAAAEVRDGKQTGIEFQGDADILQSQVAGNSIINWNNYYGHTRDRDMVKDEISLIFRDCLFEISHAKRLVFILDHWDKATRELQDWLDQYLLDWCREQPDFNAFTVVGCESLPEWYEERWDIQPLAIEGLPIEAVRFYWLVLRNLTPESLERQVIEELRNPTIMTARAKDEAGQDRHTITSGGHG